MKKLFLSIVILVAGITSCSRNDVLDSAAVSGETAVTISAALPAEMDGTRAAGDGTQVNRCQMEVYLDGQLYGERKVAVVSGGVARFEMRVVAGKTYDFVFWADAANGSAVEDFSDNHYDTGDFSNVVIKDAATYKGNDDTRDAFFGKETVEITASQSVTAKLYRPFGQLNIKTLDIQEVKDANIVSLVPSHVSIAFEDVPMGINLLTGELLETTDAVAYTDKCAVIDENGTLSMDYVFAPKGTEQYLANFTMSFFNAEGGEAAADYEFTNIPVQRNYRTNVSGNLLTKKADITVNVIPGFENEISVGPWDGTVSAPDIDEEAKTVAVNSAAQAAGLAELVNGGNSLEGYTVSLGVDLDLNNMEWTPVGSGERSGDVVSGNGFKGVFDGRGHTVSNLKISSTQGADHAVALFGAVDGGTVKNLNIDADINVPTSELGGAAVGVLLNGGTVSNVEVRGKVSVKNGGGIVGRVIKDGTVVDCKNYAAVSGTKANIGGIVGAAYYTAEGKTMTIENCENHGAVTGTNYVVGGIVGLSAADVRNCTNEGAVTGNGNSIGGVVAEQQNAGSVIGCVNKADVENKNNTNSYGTGGIIGWMRYSGATSAYPSKNIIDVTNNKNYGSIKGGSGVGGIVGTAYNYGNVNDNKNYAPALSGSNFVAGIVGNAQFAETPAGMTDPYMLNVKNNYSSTPMNDMTGGLKDRFVYINNAEYVTLEGNTPSDEEFVLDQLAQGGDVKLDADVDFAAMGGTFNVERDTNIDLNGKKVTLSSDQLVVKSGVTLTIDGEGTMTAPNIVIDNDGGNVIVNGGTFKATNVNSGAVIYSTGDVTINGGTFDTNSSLAIQSVYGRNVTINGGTITSRGAGDYGILMHGSGVLTITGGKITGNFGCIRTHSGTTVNISGGEFICTGRYYALFVGGDYGGNAIANVSGGKFRSTSTSNPNVCMYVNSGSTLNITGGEFQNKGYDANTSSEVVPAAGYVFADNDDATYKFKVVAE